MALSDETLIKQCLDGDDSAFGFLVDKYKGAVHALAYRKIGNYHDAEEIAQETFLKAYQKLSTLKNPSGFAGWLYVICANCCYSWLRKRRKEKEAVVPLKQLSSGEIGDFSWAKYAEEQTKQLVREALDVLPESERTVVTLYYLGGLSCGEISRFLGVSLSAVKMRLHRARKQMKKEMSEVLEQTWGKSQLGSSFTFQLMETIQKLSPFSPPKPNIKRWIPIGAIVTASLILSFGSLFTASTVPPFSLDSTKESVTVMLLELPQQAENPQIRLPVARTTNVQVGKGRQSGKDDETGKDSALGLAGNTTAEQKVGKTFSVKGVILQDGEPQAGISVYATATLEFEPLALFTDNLQAKTVTKSDGTYQFDDLPMHSDGRLAHYRLFAGVDKQWIGWARLAGVPGEFIDLEYLPVQLFQVKTIMGTVKDEGGQPIEGATVRATAMHWMVNPDLQVQTQLPPALPFFPSMHTDANGNFVVHNIQANGGATICVEKEGYGRFTVYQHPVSTPLNVTLKPAGAIEGRVIDSATGKPAKDVLLICEGKRDRSFLAQANAGVDGNYRFDGLPVDEYSISLAEQLPERTAAMVKNVSVESGQTARGVDVKLVEGGVISGKIKTKSGKPMPNIELFFMDASSLIRSVRTDEKGEYRFRAMTGEVLIPDSPQNCIPAETHPGNQFDITEGKEVDSVDYLYVGISMKGMVVTADEKPVAGALIYNETQGRIPLVKSKADGAFALPDDFPEGSKLTLAAEKPSEELRGVVTITVTPDIPVKITILKK